MSNYCRKKDCARKTSMSKKILRPCLESMQIPTPCFVPLNPSGNHPLCHYRNYNNSSSEMCNSFDFKRSPDICPFTNKYYGYDNKYDEGGRDESFARRATNNEYEYDEVADLREAEPNPNIEASSLFVTPQMVTDDIPTKMRSNKLNSCDVGTLAAPKTCCKGSQIPISLSESNDCNQKTDSPFLSDKEIQTPIRVNENINRSFYPKKYPEYRSHERIVPSQSGIYNSSIPDINGSTSFMSPLRYSGPDRDTSRQTFLPNEIQDGSSCYMNKSYANMRNDNVDQNNSYLLNSLGAHPRETCCKESGLINPNPDFSLPRFNSKYEALQNYKFQTSRTQEGCCSHIKDRLMKRKKSLKSVVCACPDEYELYSRKVKCSKNTCERENDTSCISVSCAANQAGPSCRCRYPPYFQQFSCAGNINGTCNCIDNF